MDASTTFSEWYAVVDPGFTGAKVTRRFAAVTKLASNLSLGDAISLVLLFYSQDPGETFAESIRDAVREADDTYVSRDQAELAIISAGVLDMLFTKSSLLGRACALLILCGEFGGLQGSSRVDAVVRSAEKYVQTQASRLREQAVAYPNLTDLLKPATKKLQLAAKERATNEVEPDVHDCLAIDSDLLNALKTFGTSITQSLTILEKRHLEESSVLYWLLGARALVTEESFREIKTARLALVAAHDLAKQTQQIPGPASCRAILSSVLALGTGEEVSVQLCIGALEPKEASRLLNDTTVLNPIFMPITFALVKAKEVNWGPGWENAFTAQTKLKADAVRPVESVSEQFYRELLLSRLLSGV